MTEDAAEDLNSLIAGAIWTKDIQDMTVNELDELALIEWANDPEVEFDELGLSQDAGAEAHGRHTDDQMLYGPDGPVTEDIT